MFIALAPPDAAKQELAGELRPAYDAHPRMRWNRVEDWHITLAFLGEIPVDAVALLRPPLARLAAARRPVTLALRGGGHFDERVLWSGVGGELDELHLLAAEVRSVVKGCGIEGRGGKDRGTEERGTEDRGSEDRGVAFERRPLRPHLTLARARRDDPHAVPDVAAALAGFVGRPWQAERLHLVGSNIGRGPGPIHYRDIEAWNFAGEDGQRRD